MARFLQRSPPASLTGVGDLVRRLKHVPHISPVFPGSLVSRLGGLVSPYTMKNQVIQSYPGGFGEQANSLNQIPLRLVPSPNLPETPSEELLTLLSETGTQ